MIRLSVSIDVPDLTKAESFYVKALGCKRLRNQGESMVVLSTDNAEIYLQERASGSTARPTSKHSDIVRTYERHWTPVHLDFLRKDIPDAIVKIKELGGQHEGGESGDWGSIAYCVDPFGNGFCLIDE